MPHDPLSPLGRDPDPLTLAQTTDRVRWSLPSIPPGVLDEPAELPPEPYDYSAGVFVDPIQWADAVGPAPHPGLIEVGTNEPRAFQLPHEATHRRYEPPFPCPVAQSAAGTTVVAPSRPGLHYIKILAAVIVASGAATVQFVQGDDAMRVTSPLMGAVSLAANGGFTLPPAPIETPWFFTSSDLALGIVSTTSAVNGYVLCCYSPYDS